MVWKVFILLYPYLGKYICSLCPWKVNQFIVKKSLALSCNQIMSFLMSACCCCCIVNNCHIFVIGHHQYTSTQNQNHKRNLCLSIKNRPRTAPILKLVRVICKFCSSHYLTDVSHQLGGCFGGFRRALYLYNVFIVVHENFRCLEYLSALFFTLHVQVTLISLDWIHDNV